MFKSGEKAVSLTITNSNIVSSGNGIENQLDASVVTAHHNNVFAGIEAYINVEAKDSIAKDPLFVSPTNNPDEFSLDDFKLQDKSPVIKAGEGGSFIGSQGPKTTSIPMWNLF